MRWENKFYFCINKNIEGKARLNTVDKAEEPKRMASREIKKQGGKKARAFSTLLRGRSARGQYLRVSNV